MSAANFDHAEILHKCQITEEQFAETKLEWGCLHDICEHHIQAEASLQTAARYISDRLQSVPTVHSLKVRVKNPAHLIAKIIRKKSAKPELDFQVATYESLVTDLVGIRALHLFKQDWREIHDFITATWELHERPLAYIREGDPKETQDDFRNAGCEVRDHPFGYRSLHFVVKSRPDKLVRLTEIQVRTIFEEGWSEIDHRVRYPLHSSDPYLARFLTIFNRLAGSADEMGTFIKALSLHFRDQAIKVAEIKSQVEEKEKEIQLAISRLAINETERKKLQQQIRDMQISSRQALSVDLPTFSGLGEIMLQGSNTVTIPSPTGPFITQGGKFAVLLQDKCSKCGKSYLPSLPGATFHECPECHASLGMLVNLPKAP